MQVTKLSIPPVHVAEIKATQEELNVIFKALKMAFDVSNFSKLEERLTYDEGLTASRIRSSFANIVKP